MAEPSPPRSGGGGLQAVTRKLGPLPVWAWAGVVVLAVLLYRHFRGGGAASASQPQGTTDQAYVPGFDAASMSGGGGIGSQPPDLLGTNGLGPTDAGQASGGGTSGGIGQTAVSGGVPAGKSPSPSFAPASSELATSHFVPHSPTRTTQPIRPGGTTTLTHFKAV